jgi:hypothetical protein
MATPLLLSAPVRLIRDAARAAKQKAGLMLERVTAGTLSVLLAAHTAGRRSFTPETRGRIMAQVQASEDPPANGASAPVC